MGRGATAPQPWVLRGARGGSGDGGLRVGRGRADALRLAPCPMRRRSINHAAAWPRAPCAGGWPCPRPQSIMPQLGPMRARDCRVTRERPRPAAGPRTRDPRPLKPAVERLKPAVEPVQRLIPTPPPRRSQARIGPRRASPPPSPRAPAALCIFRCPRPRRPPPLRTGARPACLSLPRTPLTSASAGLVRDERYGTRKAVEFLAIRLVLNL